jgi:L-ornithine Nalpha-acyltransferase
MQTLHRKNFIVRITASQGDVRAAQRLRYMIFFEELEAKPSEDARKTRLDFDRFDGFSDHLLVIDTDSAVDDGTQLPDGRLVGTYRLLRQDVARENGGFYSRDEFDLAPLLTRQNTLSFLEVGRSCVAQGYRNRRVAELLWQGIWNYVRHHKLDVMLGCASLSGTDPAQIADELTFLGTRAKPPRDWHVTALDDRHIPLLQKDIALVNERATLQKLPTLLKGYLRLGCYIADGAVIDYAFNTTDVLVVLPIAAINPRYFEYYGAPDQLRVS